MIGSNVSHDVTSHMPFTASFSPSVMPGNEHSFHSFALAPSTSERHDVHTPFVATTVSRDHVAWDGNRYNFIAPLTLILESDEDGWSYYCPTLDLVGGGSTIEEAATAFDSEFAFLWEEIACEDDKKLLPRACELKEQLRQLVSGVGKAA